MEIEQGRYRNIKANERFGKLCKKDVEDEIHFLLQCPHLHSARQTTLSKIYRLYPSTENLRAKDKFIWLMSTKNSYMFHMLEQLLASLAEERNNKLKTLN